MDNKMGVLPVKKLISTMSFPPMLSLLVSALYNVVDSIFVAKVSEDALAAVTLVFPIQMLMVAFNAGVGVGLASLISRRLGQDRKKEANIAATHGFLIALLLWICYALFAIFLAPLFLRLFTDSSHSQAIFDMALSYCRIVMLGSIFWCFSVVIERILQATGNMLYPMIFNLTGAAINTVLAPIFIIGYFGAPALGVQGAGYVAIFGQTIACIIALILFFGKKNIVHITAKGFRPRAAMFRDIFTVAAPSIVMMAAQPILVSGLNGVLIVYSTTTAVAVLGVYFRIATFVTMPVIGINQGGLPVMGYNYGAKNRLRLNAAYKISLKLAIIIMATGTVIFWIFPVQIMGLFSASAEMTSLGVIALRSVSVSWVPAAFVIVNIALFQALAHGIFALVISLARQIGIILPVAYIIAAVLHQPDWIWVAFPVAEIAAFALSFIFHRRINKNEIARLPDGAPVA